MATQIPFDILILISNHLDRNSLTVCIRVNQEWRTAFLPAIWRYACISCPSFLLPQSQSQYRPTSDKPVDPTLEVLQRHAHLVQDFVLQKDITQEQQAALHFPHVKRLSLFSRPDDNSGSFDTSPPLPAQDQIWASFLRKHRSTLEHLFLYLPPSSFSARSWQTVAESSSPSSSSLPLTTFARWKTISIAITQMDSTAVSFLWDTSSSLQELSLSDIRFDGALPSLPHKTSFRNLKKLVLTRLTGIPMEDQLGILLHCPHLLSVTWQCMPAARHSRDSMSVCKNAFLQAMEDGHWQQLESLVMDLNFSDEELETILKAMKQVKDFKVVKATFGVGAFKALEPHFLTLESLEFDKTLLDENGPLLHARSASAIVQRVLESCPKLDSIAAERLLGKDIMAGEPWVCTRLNNFRVFVELDGSLEQQNEVMDRLAQLKDLRLLSVGIMGYSHFLAVAMGRGPALGVSVDFRLEMGLSKLRTLKNLVSLTFGGTRQRIGVEEAKWMVENWKRIRLLHGTLNSDTEVAKEVDGILRASGLKILDTL